MSPTNPRERIAALAPPPERDWYRINKAPTSKSAEVYVYGTIGGGWWGDGVTAGEFNREVDALDVDEITLYVNSGGGGVSDAIAMRNHLMRHKATVTAHVDGIAASAASFLITGADVVVMGENAELMIHDALSIAMGNAADFRDAAESLDATSDNIASMYAKKAGGDAADWRALMIAETWYSAEEAVEAGLADRVGSDEESGEDTADAVPRSIFAYAGRGEAPAPLKVAAVAEIRSTYPSAAAFHERLAAVMNERRHQPPAEPGSTTPKTNHQEGADTMPALNKEIATLLGLQLADAELTDEVVLKATKEALEERAEAPAATTPVPGTVVVEQGVFDQMKAQAEQGAAAFRQVESTRREGIVDQALREGKIAATSRDTWLENLAQNEKGAVALLATLTPGTVLNTVEHGHAGDPAATSDGDTPADALWAKFQGTDTEKEN